MDATTIPVFCGNGHDNGYTLIRGREITGPRVGHVYHAVDGLVLEIDADEETYLPDDGADAARILASAGFELDADSLPLIDALSRDED